RPGGDRRRGLGAGVDAGLGSAVPARPVRRRRLRPPAARGLLPRGDKARGRPADRRAAGGPGRHAAAGLRRPARARGVAREVAARRRRLPRPAPAHGAGARPSPSLVRRKQGARDAALGQVRGPLRRLARLPGPQGRAPRRHGHRAQRARAALAAALPVAPAVPLPHPPLGAARGLVTRSTTVALLAAATLLATMPVYAL